jgi:predicted metal-dependent hydrolase
VADPEDAAPTPELPGALPFRVEVVRSQRRRRTASATFVSEDLVRVSLPAWIGPAEETEWVDDLVGRLVRKHRADAVDLEARARQLARRYGLPTPASVRWSARQRQRWGSCSVQTGAIRVSDRLAGWPPWVLDYVLVHELAHLVHADHGPAFQALVDRFPRAERARGFLLAATYGALGTVAGDDDLLDDARHDSLDGEPDGLG